MTNTVERNPALETCHNKTGGAQQDQIIPSVWKHTDQPWLLGKFLLLTWQGWCSSADSRTGRSRGWCRRRPVSTRNAGWERWPQLEVGTEPVQRAGSLVGTAPAPLVRPVECVPEQQQRTNLNEWLTYWLTNWAVRLNRGTVKTLPHWQENNNDVRWEIQDVWEKGSSWWEWSPYLPAEALLTPQQIHNFSFHCLLSRLIVQLQHQDLQTTGNKKWSQR